MFYAKEEHDCSSVCRANVLTPEVTNNAYVLPVHFPLDKNIESRPRDIGLNSLKSEMDYPRM